MRLLGYGKGGGPVARRRRVRRPPAPAAQVAPFKGKGTVAASVPSVGA